MPFPTDRKEVYRIAASFVKKIREWHEETFSEFKNELTQEERDLMPPEVREIYEQLDDFLDCVAAHPDFREFVCSWMFEISCDQPIYTSEEEVEKKGLENFLSTIGGMYRRVDTWFIQMGASVTERCISKSGWSMSVACTEDEVNTFCEEAYESFEKDIINADISVRKVFYCNRLIGLTMQNYKEYLDEDDEDVIQFKPDKGFFEEEDEGFEFEVELDDDEYDLDDYEEYEEDEEDEYEDADEEEFI